MKEIKCRICKAKAKFIFEGRVIDLNVKYYECENCGYVFTEKPYWLDRAYSDVMNLSDTGIMARNLVNVRIVLVTLFILGKLDGKVIDYAGGYGILVRLLRDFGINAYWSDPYAENLLARGFENDEENSDLVTAFEAFEHFTEPNKELDKLFSIAPNILFSTKLIPEPTPSHQQWWYYGKEHGQHVGFFREKTLRVIANRRNKYLISNGRSYHLMVDRSINSNLWRASIKLNKPLSFILKKLIKPKTWEDHERLSKNLDEL